MNIAEAKQQVMDTVDGYLTQDETGAYLIAPAQQRPLFLVGAPGIGKTAIIGQVAHELGIGLVSYSMTHHTRQSALGLPFIVEKEYKGTKFSVSEYTMSEIIASIYDYMEKTGLERGILFLDEINCVSETLYPSMLQFLQFKTFGRHRVPDGWVIVCAGNPPEYNKSVHDFDVVTLDRLRKVEIEPDLASWLDYAVKSHVHPAVVSYLQVKQSHFYSVESTPEGKSFVTARAWDDLSKTVQLFEGKGKQVGPALIGQFLQDPQIAERFAQYYALFQKYRSDYQVGKILAGQAPEDILARARAARFDERLALVRLVLDALDSELGAAVERESVVALVRDELRAAKPALMEGGAAQDVLGKAATRLQEEADRRVKLEVATDADVRPQRLAARCLRELVGTCAGERAFEGPASFSCVQQAYNARVADFRAQVERASGELDNAFSFVDAAFEGEREMRVFVAELTARPATSQFIGAFGNDSYYAHNGSVLVQERRDGLSARLADFDVEQAASAVAAADARRAQEEREAACCGGCC